MILRNGIECIHKNKHVSCMTCEVLYVNVMWFVITLSDIGLFRLQFFTQAETI